MCDHDVTESEMKHSAKFRHF